MFILFISAIYLCSLLPRYSLRQSVERILQVLLTPLLPAPQATRVVIMAVVILCVIVVVIVILCLICAHSLVKLAIFEFKFNSNNSFLAEFRFSLIQIQLLQLQRLDLSSISIPFLFMRSSQLAVVLIDILNIFTTTQSNFSMCLFNMLFWHSCKWICMYIIVHCMYMY